MITSWRERIGMDNGRLNDGSMMEISYCHNLLLWSCFSGMLTFNQYTCIYRVLLGDNYFNVFTVQVAKIIKLICLGNNLTIPLMMFILFQRKNGNICYLQLLQDLQPPSVSGAAAAEMKIFRSKKISTIALAPQRQVLDTLSLLLAGLISKNSD